MDGSIALVKNWDEEYESCFGKQENLRKKCVSRQPIYTLAILFLDGGQFHRVFFQRTKCQDMDSSSFF